MNNNPTVNDGKGFWDNVGMCDVLANDLNELVKNAVSGQFIKCSAIVYNMTIKLGNLKKGIKEELSDKDRTIEELKRVNDALVEEKTGLPVDKEGDVNG